MPSKHSLKPTIRLPVKKAKVGTVLSGILCAAPGIVQISSMTHAVLHTNTRFEKRTKVKLAWPMAIINLSLESMKNGYLISAITLKVQNHYRSHPKNLYVSALQMYSVAHIIESKKLAPEIQFCHCNILAGFLPNVFIVINTHSNKFSGMLQLTGGHTGDTNTTIMEILQAYLRKKLLMRKPHGVMSLHKPEEDVGDCLWVWDLTVHDIKYCVITHDEDECLWL
ncbi:hypothetical protein BDR05DRAFT_950951 [Suillus weaverae]|nr:hypothetical protein BDR05DRAFT_950951 [Suillus weaverae]